ncbi:MAG: transglycosylase SLT domain-containing protein, partial [Candidatus Gastranaerophilales bacterium]|nr:transglycosylase SLT domain-containing protein [Candidatus Gastranaerophilales bacterium]
MTQGISQSLNLALARVNYIENSFAQLEGIAQNFATPVNTIESDFKKILDKKLEETDTIEKTATQEEKTNVSAEIKLEDEIKTKPEIKEAIELKSKIDLKAQSANIDELIETFSEKYNIDSDFIKAIIKQESGFNAKATSKKG